MVCRDGLREVIGLDKVVRVDCPMMGLATRKGKDARAFSAHRDPEERPLTVRRQPSIRQELGLPRSQICQHVDLELLLPEL